MGTMRIPEPFFPLINRAMRVLLDSPLHGLMSNSILTIRFTGRRTGRVWSLPVRYVREDGGVSARGEGFEAAVADAVLVHFALGD